MRALLRYLFRAHQRVTEVESIVECLRGVGDGFATILLQNWLHGDVDCSVLCTTHKAETWFGFNYLQFMGLYSKCPELAFNQWGGGSSPARLMLLTADSKRKSWQ